jgi:hypothetical protein
MTMPVHPRRPRAIIALILAMLLAQMTVANASDMPIHLTIPMNLMAQQAPIHLTNDTA